MEDHMTYSYSPPNLGMGRYQLRQDLPVMIENVMVGNTVRLEAGIIYKLVWAWPQAKITNGGPTPCWWQVDRRQNISELPPGYSTILPGSHVFCWTGDQTWVSVEAA
jgi:hypothetical protein